MQEHMAIDVSPGPIRPIRLISHYFPHFYPTAEPALRPPDPRPPVTPVRSALQNQLDPEPEGDSDDSSELGWGGRGNTLGSAHPGRHKQLCFSLRSITLRCKKKRWKFQLL